MFSPDPNTIHACWEGSQVIDSDFVWPAQYFQCLREVLCDPMFGDTGDPMFGDTGDPYLLFVWKVQKFSMAPRSSLCIRSACVAGAIF